MKLLLFTYRNSNSASCLDCFPKIKFKLLRKNVPRFAGGSGECEVGNNWLLNEGNIKSSTLTGQLLSNGNNYEMIYSSTRLSKKKRNRMLRTSISKVNIKKMTKRKENFKFEPRNRFEIFGKDKKDVEKDTERLCDTIKKSAKNIGGIVMTQ